MQGSWSLLAETTGITAVVALLVYLWWHRRREATRTPAYRRRASVLSPTHCALYNALTSVLGEHARVLPLVRLHSVLELPDQSFEVRSRWSRLLRHRVDFIICTPNSLAPVVAVKIAPRMRRKVRVPGGDELLAEDALGIAGIPLVRFPAREEYDTGEVGQKIHVAIARAKEHTAQVGNTVMVASAAEVNTDTTGPMGRVRRLARRGAQELRYTGRAIGGGS